MRDYRDYGPPPSRYDDYRRPPPMAERDRYGAPDRGRYDYRSGPPAPPHPTYERYDRRAERYPAYGPPGGRPRTPPRYREDLDRSMPRYVVQKFTLTVVHTRSTSDYPDYRGRPMTPPRYPDYPTRGASPDARFRSVPPTQSVELAQTCLGVALKVPLVALLLLLLAMSMLRLIRTIRPRLLGLRQPLAATTLLEAMLTGDENPDAA